MCVMSWAGVVVAQSNRSPDVLLSVDQSSVYAGETLVVDVAVVTYSGDPATPDPVDFSPFAIVEQPADSTQKYSGYFNGVVVSKMTTTRQYRLRAPGRPGTYTLGPATVTIDGKTHRSGVAQVSVEEFPTAEEGPGKDFPVPYTRPLRRPIERETRGHLFIRPTVSKEARRIREEVRVRWELWFRSDVMARVAGFAEGLQRAQIVPRLDEAYSDFFVHVEQDVSRDASNSRTEIVDGVTYQVIPLRTLRLFPQKRGELTIDPYILAAPVYDLDNGSQPRNRRLFSHQNTVTLIIPSSPITLTVEGLPEEGRPAGFAGAVGDITLRASASRTSATEREDLITVAVTAIGTGYLSAFPRPRFSGEGGGDFSVYDVVEENGEVSATSAESPLAGRRSWQFALRPERAGDLEIPPFELPTFSPTANEYRVIATEPIAVKIERSAELAAGARDGEAGPGGGDRGAADGVAAMANDLGQRDLAFLDSRPWREAAGVRDAMLGTVGGVAAWLPAAGMGLWVLALVVPSGARTESAARRLQRIEREAIAALDRLGGDASIPAKEFGAQLATAMRRYLAACHGRSAEGLTAYDARDLAGGAGAAREQLGLQWAHLLETADAFRYASSDGEREELVRLAGQLISSTTSSTGGADR
jgi:hypothetical protein